MEAQRERLIQQSIGWLNELMLPSDARRPALYEMQRQQQRSSLYATQALAVRGQHKARPKQASHLRTPHTEYKGTTVIEPTEADKIVTLHKQIQSFSCIAHDDQVSVWTNAYHDKMFVWFNGERYKEKATPSMDVPGWTDTHDMWLTWLDVLQAIHKWTTTTTSIGLSTASDNGMYVIRKSQTKWTVVGHTIIHSPSPKPSTQLKKYYVHWFTTVPKHQGQGHGALMFGLFLQHIRQQGVADSYVELQNTGGIAGCTVYARASKAVGMNPYIGHNADLLIDGKLCQQFQNPLQRMNTEYNITIMHPDLVTRFVRERYAQTSMPSQNVDLLLAENKRVTTLEYQVERTIAARHTKKDDNVVLYRKLVPDYVMTYDWRGVLFALPLSRQCTVIQQTLERYGFRSVTCGDSTETDRFVAIVTRLDDKSYTNVPVLVCTGFQWHSTELGNMVWFESLEFRPTFVTDHWEWFCQQWPKTWLCTLQSPALATTTYTQPQSHVVQWITDHVHPTGSIVFLQSVE